jgi:thymidylate synthase (FAD)
MSSDLKVTLVRTNANDEIPIQMAQASLGKDEGWTLDPEIDPQRFLNALVKPRHGVPFEHDIWTFFVEVPIFVARQWVKHRHASMNEMSGRYVKLLPKFYTMPDNRPLVNVGTKMKPLMVAADDPIARGIQESDYTASYDAWHMYEARLAMGIAEEYARIVLPVNVFTQFYWSVNSRALMGFLERRVESVDNRVPTHPQWEIDQAAGQVEDYFEQFMPLTRNAFVAAGRVAP